MMSKLEPTSFSVNRSEGGPTTRAKKSRPGIADFIESQSQGQTYKRPNLLELKGEKIDEEETAIKLSKKDVENFVLATPDCSKALKQCNAFPTPSTEDKVGVASKMISSLQSTNLPPGNGVMNLQPNADYGSKKVVAVPTNVIQQRNGFQSQFIPNSQPHDALYNSNQSMSQLLLRATDLPSNRIRQTLQLEGHESGDSALSSSSFPAGRNMSGFDHNNNNNHSSGYEDGLRDRKRAKNRDAAKRCREKKIRRIDELGEQVKTLSQRNEQMERDLQSLVRQCQKLRYRIETHRQNGCIFNSEMENISMRNLDFMTASST